MTYSQALQYLESFINYEKIPQYSYKESLKLGRIEGFLSLIGNPQRELRCIHIAGTKGKGSTCAFIAYILRQAGYKVGLYTSPHLTDFRERIRILNELRATNHEPREFEGMISKSELVRLVEKLKPSIEHYNKISQYDPLSFFEIYTSLAFLYFKQKKVDFAVIETGLGGRLDATNTVYPLVSVVTPISYEHTQKLGNTLRQIATEKAGIIKVHNVQQFIVHSLKDKRKNLTVIMAPQEKEAEDVIKKQCKKRGAKLYIVGKDIHYSKTSKGFDVKGLFRKYKDLKIRLIGEHQIINATVATAAIEALKFYDIHINKEDIRKGLYNTLWPGRCEVVSRNPTVLLDGAQNIASSKVLAQAVKENFRYNRLILVFGISKDKDIPGVCAQLCHLPSKIVLTKADNPRATPPEKLVQYFKDKEIYLTNSVKEARKLAKDLAEKDDLILVTGSLFILGEFRK